MLRGLIIAVAVLVVVAVALFEGLRSNRWGESDDSKAAAEKLSRVPREFGEWVGTDSALDAKIVKIAEAAGYVNRSYVNRKNGEQIDVLLLCGPSGPIGAHTPDVCYGGLGYKCLGNPIPRQVTPTSGKATFWTARFEKVADATDHPLRVFWAWGVDGDWEASKEPRLDFAGRTVLNKLYLVRHANPNDDQGVTDAFLTEFLPVVKTALQ